MRFTFTAENAESEENFRRYASRLGGSGGVLLSDNISGSLLAVEESGERIGFLSVSGGELEAFFVSPDHYRKAEAAFDAALNELKVSSARILTCDSPLVALCCTRWKTVRASTLCYEYVGSPTAPDIIMDCARESDLPVIENSGYIAQGRLRALADRHGIYVVREGEGITAFGFTELGFGDGYGFVGGAVRSDKRMEGRGRAVLARLGEMLKDYNTVALAKCPASDTAYSRALEKAGYVCYDKLLKAVF